MTCRKARVRLVAAAAMTAAVVSPGVAADRVEFALTYPNGSSPKVFTVGWTFGARAVLNPGTSGATDLSREVVWSGSGTFSPKAGPVSHPRFASAGANHIVLSVTVGKTKFAQRFAVDAVAPDHAVVGWTAACSADAHGCPSCPHGTEGHIKTGNPKVKIGGKPVACVGDTGTHDMAPCCGPGTFTIVEGDPSVRVDGKPVARRGSRTQHCGGLGTVGGKPGKPVARSTSYRGTFSGDAAGTASFAAGPTGLRGTLVGRHTQEGGGSVNLRVIGVYMSQTHPVLLRAHGRAVPPDAVVATAEGDLAGTTTYIGLNGKKATARVKGRFKGLAKQKGTFTGTWTAVAVGLIAVKAEGQFKTTLVRK